MPYILACKADAGDTAVDVADQKTAGITGRLPQLVLGLEERGGERAVGIGVDQGAEGARLVVGAFGNVAAGEHRHRAEKMVGVLLIDDAFDRDLRGRIAMRIFQADADAADAPLEQRAGGRHDLGVVRRIADADDVGVGHEAIQDEAAGLGAVEVLFVAAGYEQADAGAVRFGENVGGDRGRPANQLDMFEELGGIGETQLGRALRQAIEQADGEIVRSGVDLGAGQRFPVAEQSVRQSSANIDVNSPHEVLTRHAN